MNSQLSQYEPPPEALRWFASWVMRESSDDCWLSATWAQVTLIEMADKAERDHKAWVEDQLRDGKGG